MMQLTVTHPDGSKMPLFSSEAASGVTKAEQSTALLAEDVVNISMQSAAPLSFMLGDAVEVYGKTYTLNQLPSIRKQGERNLSYDLTFEGAQYELLDAQFMLPDGTVGDSLTGTLFTFLQILVSNANRVFPGKWTVGEYPDDTEYKTLTFSGENCLAVLQRLCEEYGQEFEIAQSNGARVLHIRTAGVHFPYTFRYGRTGGLYELTRQNISSKNVATRLFAYGGTSNVPGSYFIQRNSHRICLPNKNKSASYVQSAEAVAAFGVKENTKTFDEIFPNRYGVVTSLGSKYYAFVDNTMFDLNEADSNGTKWLIAGTSAKVHFNTGKLAGYEFDVHKYEHATKTVEIVPFQDENGMKFPSEDSSAFQIGLGDQYFFVDINLPDSYIAEAEQKLQAETEAYYAQNSQPQVQYGLTIDENFIAQFAGELTVVNLFAVGDYIPVQDPDVGVDKSVRITGFTRDLLRPYKYAITLGDAVAKSPYVRLIADQRAVDRVVAANDLADPAKARRNWRASQEVLAMVFDPDGDYYSGKIKPLSIDTSMLSVGAKSMQFVLRNVIFEPNYQGNPNYIRVSGGSLIHFAIENDTKVWNIAAAEFSNLTATIAYYIYARCKKSPYSHESGSIIFDANQRKVDHEDGYYTFLVGTLSSVFTDSGYTGANPARIVSLTYGSTTVNGRYITTGRIRSADGNTYFDLDGSEIKGCIVFTSGSSGYDNISDKPDLSPYDEAVGYIDNVLPNTLNRLQTQIDNAIESWFYHYDPTLSNAPASSWTTEALKNAHLDDTFTNLDSGQSWRFTKSESDEYGWVLMADTAATKALVLAGQAKDTADGKRRVFVATPTTPYDVGDLWVNGQDLRRCATARASGSYVAGDWVLATGYDNTQTVIDGGVVTSGTVQLAGSNSAIKAGITGDGTADSSVRIWAGATKANKSTAPFRVMQDGSLVASKAKITGEIQATSGSIGGFEISGNRIGVEDNSQYNGLSLYNDFIKFSEDGIWAGIGTNVLPASSGLAALARFENTKANAMEDNYGVFITAKNGVRNHALVLEGDILGFAVAVKQIDSDYTATKNDCVISCYNNSKITVTLPSPSEVQVGKVYTIKTMRNGYATDEKDVIVSCPYKIFDLTTGSTFTLRIASNANAFCTLVNDGSYWIVIGR